MICDRANLFLFLFKVSLILELCSRGNLRSFLVDNQKELILSHDRESISSYSKNNSHSDISKDRKFGFHSLFLWSYQVIYYKLIL